MKLTIVLILKHMKRHWKRQNFKTKIVDGQKTEFVPDGKQGIPPKNSKFSLVNYPSKLGEMPMYITAKENNGKKYPAIIYLNGGFGGIGDSKFDWDEDIT